MQDFQVRVIDEKQQLDSRLDKLESFLSTETFNRLPMTEQHRLRHQADLMDQLSLVLGERIENFDKSLVG